MTQPLARVIPSTGNANGTLRWNVHMFIRVHRGHHMVYGWFIDGLWMVYGWFVTIIFTRKWQSDPRLTSYRV
jgi:hypothetical protein